MIKLVKHSRPEKLTDQEQKKLTDEFINSGFKKAVWSKTYIKEELLAESHSKCAYCETFIGKGEKEMHIDHFYPKSKYPDKVVEWDNLIPSCPHCNKEKSDLDPNSTPIINPYNDNPHEYFYLYNCRLKPKHGENFSKAKNTIDCFGINDTKELVSCRFLCGDAIIQKIEDLTDKISDYQNYTPNDIRHKKAIIRLCKNILKLGVETSEYGACMATIIHESDDYINAVKSMKSLELWNDELEELHNKSKSIKFDIRDISE